MRFRLAALLAGLAVALALAGAGTASAESAFSIEGETTLTLTGRLSYQSELVEVICEVTMRELVEQSADELSGLAIGRVNDLRTAGCRTNTGTFRAITILGLTSEEDGWGLVYKSILGTLPSPTGYAIQIERAQVLIEISLFGTDSCLYAGSIETLTAVEARGALERTRTTSERPATVEVPLARRLAGICPERGRVLASLTPSQSTRITLTRAAAVPYLRYDPPDPVRLAAGINSVNVQLRSGYDIQRVTEIRVADETNGRYRAGIGTCVESATYAPRVDACRIEVRRNAGTTGLGSVTVRYRSGYGAVYVNKILPVQVEGL